MKSLISPVEPFVKLVHPLAISIGLPTLSFHVHEIIIAFILYHTIYVFISPLIARRVIPRRYQAFDPTNKNDLQRVKTTAFDRVWGYSEAAASVQAFATGYFIWDLVITIINLQHVGLAVLTHAASCCAVYLLGFRPVFNYYSCIFMLYELSTPFLNIHMFLNQLGEAGSMAQVANGILLMSTFFGARIVWGWVYSFQWYHDIYTAGVRMHRGTIETLPTWLVATFVLSNATLNCLNLVWFAKMVETIKNREAIARDAHEMKQKKN